jgi:hypothetical protein
MATPTPRAKPVVHRHRGTLSVLKEILASVGESRTMLNEEHDSDDGEYNNDLVTTLMHEKQLRAAARLPAKVCVHSINMLR